MSDSDSGSEFVDCQSGRQGSKIIYDKSGKFVALQPPDTTYERWSGIPIGVKKEAAQLMNICAFWYPILLLRQEGNTTTRWAVEVGFIDSNEKNDLSLKRLYRIEILEAILRAMEKGCFAMDQTRHMVWISNKFNLHAAEVFGDAVQWLERTGEPRIRQQIQDLGHFRNCYMALQHVFTEYAHYVQAMSVNRQKTMSELGAGPPEYDIEVSEEMKSKGNENFQKKKYDAAVKCYSKAIRHHPENHIIYGNRALCYIRCEKYLKAVADGKRAILLEPMWAKGHYRYCEALFSLGERKRAIEANAYAQRVCKGDREGMRDLEVQQNKFTSELQELKAGPSTKSQSKSKTEKVESRPPTAKPAKKVEPTTTSSAPQSKVSEVKKDSQTQQGKKEGIAHPQDNTKDSKKAKSDMADKKTSKTDPGASAKQKIKSRNDQAKEKKATDSGIHAGARDALRSAVQDGHSALTDQRSRNAEQAFSQALSLLENNTHKELGISTIDVVVLIYGRASALIDIGQPEELAAALRDFEKIKTYEERKFQCLVFYGMGKVYLKENRFPIALRPFSDSLQMVKNQITPGKLTWPATKEIVKETQPDYLKELLEKAIETCRFPPIPDAICRHQNCVGHSKVEIYFTDPDFKGFIQMVCCQSCTVEYHISCWKTLKTASFSEKNEKDFLQEPCFTPDCEGKICSIKIYGSTGLIKCKFETVIKRSEVPKMRVNQKCTSLKKLKSKEDRKLKRKQRRQASQDNQGMNEDTSPEKTVAKTQDKASSLWQLYRDRVLLQISESQELFAEEKSHNVTALMTSLKPWMELDQLKGKGLGGSIIGGQQQQLETLHQVVELLLERKNRVWARVFIQSLTTCQDITPKLQNWAHQLNNSGLNAARAFIERYAEHLEELDLALLINFAPLQDMLIEKFGTMPEFFSRRGLTVTEYLKQAPAHEMRLFIWTLEEHRDQYSSCHTVLDEYFEMMDGHCLIIKKSENENENNPPIKTKNRGRKKKQKEPKPVIYLSGMRGGTPVDGDEDIFDEDDSLIFLDHSDPFSVPNHLREQVADFEGQYNGTSHISHFKNILDNNPDPTKESLYDYFAQVLEEHGHLGAQDPLLVGQLDNFPPVAQQKIQEAGGLKPFLLESLRFVMMGPCIGLSKHAVSMMHQAGHGTTGDGLNDLDVIGDDDMDPSTHDFHPGQESVCASYRHDFGSAQPEAYIPLPSPYVFGSQIPPPPQLTNKRLPWRGDDESSHWTTAVPGHSQEPPYYSSNNLDELDLYVGEVDEGVFGEASLSSEGSSLKEPAAVQEYQPVVKSDVAVNTMPYELFESNNGDMTRKDKSNEALEKQIHRMVNNHDTVKLKHQEAIASLEKELEEINANIQVANKELVLSQQKLEEEVKRDQKEKKENQETLKALKIENKELVEKVESLARSVREKKSEYETKLNDFLELSNFSAAEKMSLEDEIKRCIDVCAKAAKRSPAAELSVLESRRRLDMYCLYRSMTDARAILAKLEEVAPRYPPQVMSVPLNSWRACVQEAEEKISATEAQFNEQMEQLKKGSRLSTLPPVCVPGAPKPPALPIHICDSTSPELSIPFSPARCPGDLPSLPPILPFMPPCGSHFVRPPPGLGLPFSAGPDMQTAQAPVHPSSFVRVSEQILMLPPGHQPLNPSPQASYIRPLVVQRPVSSHQPATQSQHSARGAAAAAAASAPGPAPGLAGAQRQPQVQVQAQAQAAQPGQGARPLELHHNTMFDKVLERLGTMFPYYSRPVLMQFVQQLRAANNGSLSSLDYKEVISRVTQIILDHQEQMNSAGDCKQNPSRAQGVKVQHSGTSSRSDSPSSVRSTGTPPPAHVWHTPGAQRASQPKALNMEDPCIICHDDMSPDDTCVLECRHTFHTKCIKSWLKEQSTCPTCREHALLPEDFPMLPGRIRRGHAPAAFS